MSVNIPLVATTKTVCEDLTVNTVVDLYVSQQQSLRAVLESMSICNDGAASTDFTLQLFDGSATFKIYDTFPVAAHATLFIKDHAVAIPNGWKMQVKASAGNFLHVVAVIAEVSSVRGQ